MTMLTNANHSPILGAPVIGIIGLHRDRYNANESYEGKAGYSDDQGDLARS